MFTPIDGAVSFKVNVPLIWFVLATPDSKVHGANMGPTWVLSAPDGPHVGPMNLAIRDCNGQAKIMDTDGISQNIMGFMIIDYVTVL